MGPAPMRTHSTTTSTKADSFRRLEVITGVGRRRRWSDEDKARIVAESLDPATTASAVERRYGLHANQLFVWAVRVSARGRAPEVYVADPLVPDPLPRPVGANGVDRGVQSVAKVRVLLADRDPGPLAKPTRVGEGRPTNS